MSNFHTENPRLYEELGLEGLLQEGISDHLPVQPLEEYETPLDLDQYTDFFERLESRSLLDYGPIKKSADIMALAIESSKYPPHLRKDIDIPLLPNRSEGIYDHEQTQATHALRELAYRLTGADIVADETTPDFPLGRVWLQGRYAGYPVNFIEDHMWDNNGHLLKLSIVKDTPEDIRDALRPAPAPVYSPETARAIKISRKLGKISKNHIHEARDAELDYVLDVRKLPTANFESPYDKAA